MIPRHSLPLVALLLLLTAGCGERMTPGGGSGSGNDDDSTSPAGDDDDSASDDDDDSASDDDDDTTPDDDDSASDDDDSASDDDDSADAPEAIRFVAMGDTGTGSPDQYAVASVIQTVCAAQGCDFVILLGDNFYDIGVGSVTDPQWDEKFEDPYADILLPFYPALGNHD